MVQYKWSTILHDGCNWVFILIKHFFTNISVEKIGIGTFGVVWEAKALQVLPNEVETVVAVKALHKNAEIKHMQALANELKMMIYLGNHKNIVNLIGACTKKISRGTFYWRYIFQIDPQSWSFHKVNIAQCYFSVKNF